MSNIGTISHVDKNNFAPATDGYALSIEPLDQTWSRYDFMFQSMDNNVTLGNGVEIYAGLLPNRVGAEPSYTFVKATCPVLVEWTTNDPVDGSFNYLGIPGTVTEIWRSFGTEISRRLNVDPGAAQSGTIKRDGPVYTILLSGSEYRGYVHYKPSGGQQPQIKVAGPVGGFVFPIRLGMRIAGSVGDVKVRNVAVGGVIDARTVYSAADKARDGITTHMHLRIYQKGRFEGINGFPVDIDT